MTEFLADLRCASRSLAKNPGFAAAAITTLALGIGANTVIFSLADAVLLRPLPYREPERLVVLYEGRCSRPRIATSSPPPISWTGKARAAPLKTWPFRPGAG